MSFIEEVLRNLQTFISKAEAALEKEDLDNYKNFSTLASEIVNRLAQSGILELIQKSNEMFVNLKGRTIVKSAIGKH